MTADPTAYGMLFDASLGPDLPAPRVRIEEPRRSNLISVIARLHLAGPQSRSELVAGLGLSRSTVGSLVTELVDAGVAIEAGVDRQPSPGRPSLVVRLNPRHALALAIALDADHVQAAVMGLGGEVLASDAVTFEGGEHSMDEIHELTKDMVGRLLEDVPETDRIVGVGVAVAGMVNAEDARLEFAPNLGWRMTDIRRTFADVMPADAWMEVGNEATLATVAEYLRGSLRGIDNGALMNGEVGVGGGAIVNGRLLYGAAGMALEIGHVPVNPEGHVCGCGAVGCLESEVGVRTILSRAGLSPDAKNDDGSEAFDRLLELAAAHDHRVQPALKETANWLARGLAIVINLLNPARVVISGRLGDLVPMIRTTLEAQLEAACLAPLLAKCEIVAPTFGHDAPLVGAGEQVFWKAINQLDGLLAGRTRPLPTKDDAHA